MSLQDNDENNQREGEKCTQGAPHPRLESNRQKDEERVQSGAVPNNRGSNELLLQGCNEDPDDGREVRIFESRKLQEANYKERDHRYRWTEVGNKIERAWERTPKKWIR
jgi:hypothetical protein